MKIEKYEVKSEGFVVNSVTGRVLKVDKSPCGHHRITLCIGGIAERHYLHRLVAKGFVENPDNKPFVNHKDGNKDNNHFSNLEWVTIQENTIHAFDMGLRNSGEKSYQATSSDQQIREICKRLVEGAPSSEICREFQISRAKLYDIRRRKSWSRVTKDYVW